MLWRVVLYDIDNMKFLVVCIMLYAMELKFMSSSFLAKKEDVFRSASGSRSRVHAALKYTIKVLGMNEVKTLEYSSSRYFLGAGVLRNLLSNIDSKVSVRLSNCGVPPQMTPLQSASFLLAREFMERDVAFLRRFFRVSAIDS